MDLKKKKNSRSYTMSKNEQIFETTRTFLKSAVRLRQRSYSNIECSYCNTACPN